MVELVPFRLLINWFLFQEGLIREQSSVHLTHNMKDCYNFLMLYSKAWQKLHKQTRILLCATDIIQEVTPIII